jgi:hypothetical protein
VKEHSYFTTREKNFFHEKKLLYGMRAMTFFRTLLKTQRIESWRIRIGKNRHFSAWNST